MKTAKEIVEKIAREEEAKRLKNVQSALHVIEQTSVKMFDLSEKKSRIYNINGTFESSLNEPEVKKCLEESGFVVEKYDVGFYLVIKE